MLIASRPRRSRGLSLIEALVSILIFSIGILGLIGLQARAIAFSSDAKFRADAAFLANQLIARIAVADPAGLAGFAHQPDGGNCVFSGATAAHAAATDWVAEVQGVFAGSSPAQQIKVNAVTGDVEITICWQVKDSAMHRHVVRNRVQWQ